MKKIVLFLKRKASLTHDEFRRYYESSHVALAHKYLGHLMVDYRRNYIQAAHGIPTDSESPSEFSFNYDCITEVWIRDEAQFQEWMRTVTDPIIGPEFVADEHKFLDRAAFVMTICDEVVSDTAYLQAA